MAKELEADRKGVGYKKNKSRNVGNMVPAVPVTVFQRPPSSNKAAPVKKKLDKKEPDNDKKMVFGEAPADIIINRQSIKVKKSKSKKQNNNREKNTENL